MTQADIFGDRCCRLCAHWAGDDQHVIQQVPALCRQRTRLGARPRTYADDTCETFHDAAVKGRAA
jgi:hypothetical protein